MVARRWPCVGSAAGAHLPSHRSFRSTDLHGLLIFCPLGMRRGRGFVAALAAAIIALPAWTASARGPGEHRRRRRAGDRRRRQHFNVAEGRRAARQHARSAAGLADGGVLRGVLQEPRAARAARVDRAATRIARRGASTRSVPASSSTRPALSSPTITSSPTPTRSTSSSTTAPSSRPNWSARIPRATSRCCACTPTSRSRR